MSPDSVQALLAEQIAYCRAMAPEYSDTGIPELEPRELESAHEKLLVTLDEFRPTGDVLELASALGALGWSFNVRYVAGPFFWGRGARSV